MAEIGDKSFTTDMIQLIKDAVKAELGTNAYVNRYLAEVTAVDTTTSAVSVKLSGSDSVSDSFRARGIHLPDVGQQVVACIDGQDRWIESVIRPATSTPYVTFATAAAVPTGAVVAWLTATAPTGWLFCDGTSYAYNTYPALGALLGGSAGGNFNVPDMRDRFIGGKSTVGTWSNNSGTIGPNTIIDNERAHTHETDITHGHADTISVSQHTSHNHSFDTPSDVTSGPSQNTYVAAGSTSILVSVGTHTHTADPASATTGTNALNTSDTEHTVSGGVTSLGSTLVESDAAVYTGVDITPKSTLLNFIIKT
jgi:microcystin-dependent protein